MSNFNKKIDDTTMRLGLVRFCYPHVFEARKNEDGTKGKYDVCVLVPKSNTEAVKMLQDGIEAAKQKGKTTKWNGTLPKKLTTTLHDGDVEKDDPDFEDCYYFTASSTTKPGVRVRENGVISEALDDEDFYPGCYGAVTVNVYPFANSGNNGVSIGLNNVIKTQDGERLSGGRSAEEDFSDLAD